MLEVINIYAGYGDLKVLYDVSLRIAEGEVISLVGANGAGKTTLLNVIAGFVDATDGEVFFKGEDLLRKPTYARPKLGIAHIPQGRGILGRMTVRDNLIMGARNKVSRGQIKINMEKYYELFPILYARRNQLAGSLSGGEQQMLAISRSLMLEPELIIMDEPSLGLAPKLVNEVFAIIQDVSNFGVAILLVEQNLMSALEIADRGYVLETGHIVKEGAAYTLINDKDIQKAYMGL